eukprot:7847376-Pyramimonas_sp.AAC.1
MVHRVFRTIGGLHVHVYSSCNMDIAPIHSTCSIHSSIAGRTFSSTLDAAAAFLELVPVRRSALAPDMSPEAPPEAFFTRKGAYAPEETAGDKS